MEALVYAVYFVGMLAAFSALVVFVYASVPTRVLMRGEHAGRFAWLSAVRGNPQGKPGTGNRLVSFEMPRARAA